MMGGRVKPKDIERSGISEETGRIVRAAVRRDRRLRLVAGLPGEMWESRIAGTRSFDPLAAIRG
jgi:homoserine dehydrogenase